MGGCVCECRCSMNVYLHTFIYVGFFVAVCNMCDGDIPYKNSGLLLNVCSFVPACMDVVQ